MQKLIDRALILAAVMVVFLCVIYLRWGNALDMFGLVRKFSLVWLGLFFSGLALLAVYQKKTIGASAAGSARGGNSSPIHAAFIATANGGARVGRHERIHRNSKG